MMDQQFWKDLFEKYPEVVGKFREWIDQYKVKHHWNDLFPYKEREHYFADIKFHNLPDAMQWGVFQLFKEENKLIDTEFPLDKKMSTDIEVSLMILEAKRKHKLDLDEELKQ